jgi:hypothetical protein
VLIQESQHFFCSVLGKKKRLFCEMSQSGRGGFFLMRGEEGEKNATQQDLFESLTRELGHVKLETKIGCSLELFRCGAFAQMIQSDAVELRSATKTFHHS